MLSFNNIEIIGNCLSDLSNSTFKNIETIVLDCASRDNSASYIANNFPWVNLIRFKKDPGPDAAYTYGVKQAKGSYILLISADVRVLPNTIASLVKRAEISSLDVAVPSCLDWDGVYANAGLGWPFFHVHEYDLFSVLLPKLFSSLKEQRPFYFIFACCLVKREAYIETPFNQNIGFYEDIEWAWRLDLKGKKIEVLDDVYCLHERGSSIKGPRAYYFNSRCVFATMLVCAKTDEIVFLSPPLATFQISELLFEILNGRYKNAVNIVKGWSDFLKLSPAYLKDRKTLFSSLSKKNSFNFLQRYVEAENYKRKREHLAYKRMYFQTAKTNSK